MTSLRLLPLSVLLALCCGCSGDPDSDAPQGPTDSQPDAETGDVVADTSADRGVQSDGSHDAQPTDGGKDGWQDSSQGDGSVDGSAAEAAADGTEFDDVVSDGVADWSTPDAQADGSGPEDAGEACSNECSSGQTQCEGSNVRDCDQSSGCWQWGAPHACPDNQACSGTSCQPTGPTQSHVDIYIDNFCNVSAQPTSFDVPAGQTLQLTYHNNSVDYEGDVWLSYGGGFLGLATGGIWEDPFEFCTMPSQYTAYADLNIAGGPTSGCPGFRLYINCQ